MSRNLLPILLVVLTLGLFFLVVMGQYEKTLALLELQEEAREAKDAYVELEELETEYAVRMEDAKEDHELLDGLILPRRDDARIMMKIARAADRYNQDWERFNIERGTEGLDQDWSDIDVEPITVTLNFDTTFSGFRDFLEYLEDDLRQHDITTFSVDSLDFGTYGVNIDIQTYYWAE